MEGPPTSKVKRRKLNSEATPTYQESGQSYQSYSKYLHNFFPDSNPGRFGVAIICDNGKGQIEKLSYEEVHTGANVVRDLLSDVRFRSSTFIGVKLPLGVLYPVVILGILRSGKAFFNFNTQNFCESVSDGAVQFNLKVLISDSPLDSVLSNSFALKRLLEVEQFNLKYFIYEVLAKEVASQKESERFAYAIQTSGTTGRRKTVLVPHSCICPNIYDFIHRWKVSSHDVIFGAAPPTFDPHIIELFCAFGAGAAILYTKTDIAFSNRLVRLLETYRVSILQITPSTFRKAFVTGSRSQSLRLIAFGGETCPSKDELRSAKAYFSPDISFQNVYGVTEVSCWASVSDIDLTTEEEITIGQGILETDVSLDDSGEIIISSSTRYCVIIDPATGVRNKQIVYRTGDLGRQLPEGIVFEGRADRVVKRNGMKVHLREVEEMASQTGLVSFAECHLHESKIYLVVQLKPEFSLSPSSSLLSLLSKKLDLPLFMYPDHIISLQSIPLNSNGKIDFANLTKSFDNQEESESVPFDVMKNQVIKTLEPLWRSCTWIGYRSVEVMLNEKFLEAGGNSISAARFVESAFLYLKLFGSDTHVKYENEMRQCLLHESFHSVVELVCKFVIDGSLRANFSNYSNDLVEFQERLPAPVLKNLNNLFEFEFDEMEIEDESVLETVFNNVDAVDNNNSTSITTPIELVNMYDFDLALCVDASPAIVKRGTDDLVIIGCHGGILLCVNLSVLDTNPQSPHLAIAWKRKLPSRLEASVVTDGASLYGFVGCHDCNFYKFSVTTGATICYYRCPAPIRSKGAVNDEHELIIFVDSANSIYCLNYHDLNIIWVETSFKLLATTEPVVWKDMCYISTLDKGLVALNIRSGEAIWSLCNSSYCSTPTLYLKQDENRRKARKRPFLVNGSFTSNQEIVNSISGKGKPDWSWKSPPTNLKLQTVLKPIYSNCCDTILWIDRNFNIKLFNPKNGYCLHSLNCPELDNVEVNFPCLIKCDNCSECFLFYKMREMPKLIFINLHKQNSFVIRPWFMKEFESFSTPVICNKYLIFGGRDNKLHVISLKAKRIK